MLDKHSPYIPLYLFAKSPIPGAVKTRMQPTLSADQCAELARMMLLQSIQKVNQYWPGKLILCVSPSIADPEFIALKNEYQCELVEQIDANLGDRMLNALHQGIKTSGAAVVMGCDVPHISESILIDAHHQMTQIKNIIGPAEDGGFYLLGMHQSKAEIFDHVEWGASTVFHQVISQAKQVGIQFDKLATLRDIDRIEDLEWLASAEPQYNQFVGYKETKKSQQ